MTVPNKKKVNPLPQKHSPEVTKIHNHICSLIAAERTLRDSEQLVVSQLAQHMYLQYKAMESLITDGAVLHSENRDGPVHKASPWINVHQVSTQKILECSKLLGIPQLSFAEIMREVPKEEEDNPLKQWEEKRNKKKQ